MNFRRGDGRGRCHDNVFSESYLTRVGVKIEKKTVDLAVGSGRHFLSDASDHGTSTITG